MTGSRIVLLVVAALCLAAAPTALASPVSIEFPAEGAGNAMSEVTEIGLRSTDAPTPLVADPDVTEVVEEPPPGPIPGAFPAELRAGAGMLAVSPAPAPEATVPRLLVLLAVGLLIAGGGRRRGTAR